MENGYDAGIEHFAETGSDESQALGRVDHLQDDLLLEPASEPIELDEVCAPAPLGADLDASAAIGELPIVQAPVSATGNIAGTIASIVFHAWLISMLATFVMPDSNPLTPPPLESMFSKVEQPEELPDVIIPHELANPDDKEYEVRKVINARSVGQVLSTKATPQSAPSPMLPELTLQPSLPMYDIPEGQEIDERLVIKGTTGEAAVQIESALDRVTWEIANHLQEHKVLVVWMLDASASLIEQRKVIGKRMHRIYGELGALDASEATPRPNNAILSAVVTYGATTNFITPEPTAEFKPIVDAVNNAPTDPSGRENVFGAVDQVMHRWSRFRTSGSRSMLLIVVTDETGDDFEKMEPAIQSCKRYGAKAYVIGPSAVFGRRKGFVPYVAPENSQTYQLPVDLGPETFIVDAVAVPFWYGGSQYDYLSAGMGPYGLSRLVKETGGVYFLTSMTTMAGLSPLGAFSASTMKAFAPDYRFGTPQAYLDDIAKHPLRQAVITAADLSLKFKAKGTPNLELRVLPGDYLRLLNEAQQSAAETTFMVDHIAQPLQGKLEAEYQKEKSPRWRAAYNLAMGRLAALKVRAFEYNYACSQLKNLGTGDIATKTNHWFFKPDPKIASGAQMKKLAADAEKYLKRVVDEAPGTPWALLAQRELSAPLGFTVVQKFIQPPPPPERPTGPQTKQVRLANDNMPPRRPTPPPPRPAPPPLPNL